MVSRSGRAELSGARSTRCIGCLSRSRRRDSGGKRLAERGEVKRESASRDHLTRRGRRATDRGPGNGGDTLHLVVMDAHRELNALEGDRDRVDRRRPRARPRPATAGWFERSCAACTPPSGCGSITRVSGRSPRGAGGAGDPERSGHDRCARPGDQGLRPGGDDHLHRCSPGAIAVLSGSARRFRSTWEDTRSRSDKAIEGGLYHLASGRFEAGDDGTRAVPRASRFAAGVHHRLEPRSQAAAPAGGPARGDRAAAVGREKEYGHMAFLRAGADGLVYDALEFAGGRVARAGESLEDVLGAEAAKAYLRAVLRICSEGCRRQEGVAGPGRGPGGADEVSALGPARDPRARVASRRAERRDRGGRARRAGACDRWRRGPSPGVRRRERSTPSTRQMRSSPRLARPRRGRRTWSRSWRWWRPRMTSPTAPRRPRSTPRCCPAGHPGGRRAAAGAADREARTRGLAREYLRAVQLSVELRRGGPREDMDAFLGRRIRRSSSSARPTTPSGPFTRRSSRETGTVRASPCSWWSSWRGRSRRPPTP